MNTAQMKSRRRLLNGLIIAVGIVTIGAGVFFAAIDRPLLTAAVCFAGLLPVALLLLALAKVAQPVNEQHRLARQRQGALIIAAAGLVATLAGAVLLMSPLETLAMVLLYMGPSLLLGGLVALAVTRREAAQ